MPKEKTIIFLILSLILIINFSIFSENNEKIYGYILHADRLLQNNRNSSFKYVKGGSNWKFRDSNSLFIHIIGDSLSERDEYFLFPGYTLNELDNKTKNESIIFWKSRESLMWISAKDTKTLFSNLKENKKLQKMIEELAKNPYIEGSYANITGKDEKFKFNDYENSKYCQNTKKFSINNASDSLVGIYDLNRIDYSNPSKYLIESAQTKLKDEYINEIKKKVGKITNNFTSIVKLMEYCHKEFKGSGIADFKLSANEIFETKRIAGCTQNAVIITSILRSFGFPSILVCTVDLKTAKKTLLGESISKGHYMTEVYVNKKWILLDGNGSYCDKYNPTNPYIIRKYSSDSLSEGIVIAKGLDNWEMGLNYSDAYKNMCTEFINRLNKLEPFLKKKEYAIMKSY